VRRGGLPNGSPGLGGWIEILMADSIRELEMAIEQPPHPMHSLTTYELKNYRRELEHALKTPGTGCNSTPAEQTQAPGEV
jgi:hypothetical protein